MVSNLDEYGKSHVMLPIVGLIGLGIGGVVGYIIGIRHASRFELIDSIPHEVPKQLKFNVDDIDGYINEHNSSKHIEEVHEFVEPDNDGPLAHMQTNLKEERRSIFSVSDSDGEWDYEKETASRSPEKPYVLHRDEFYNDEMDFTQITLTYYGGDDIMVDQDDTPIYGYSEVVGPLMFGHGSDDPNVFYVRNETRRTEYEVLNDPGSYSIEVLGLEYDDDIAQKGPQVRKFRLEE
jgi:hypothetical protein